MALDTPKQRLIYFMILLALGALLVGGLSIISSFLAKGAAWGYGINLVVDLFFLFKILAFRNESSSIFLKKFFRAETQKIVLFVLLMAGTLRYIRPDFLGLLLGVIVGLLISRFLAAI